MQKTEKNIMDLANGIQTIATHNGSFHADDVFAVAVLSILNPTVKIVRTRNPEVYEMCDIIVDLGEGEFDHHQKGGNGTRPNGVPYAAFGLVWEAFGPLLVAMYGGNQCVVDIIDQKLVQGVDALDNGYNPNEGNKDFDILSVSAAISAFNPNWDDVTDYDVEFEQAVAWAKELLIRLIKSEVANTKAKSLVLDAIEKQQNGIIIFDRFVPWHDHLYTAPNNETIQFVLFRDSNSGEWRIQTVPVEPSSFVARKSLPKTWGGLRGADLNAVVGIDDGVFVHNGLFIGGAVSKESILKMAELAVNHKN